MTETSFDRWIDADLRILANRDKSNPRYPELFRRARGILDHIGVQKGKGVEFIEGVLSARLISSAGTDSDASAGTDSDESAETDSDASTETDSDASAGTDSDASAGTDSDESAPTCELCGEEVEVGQNIVLLSCRHVCHAEEFGEYAGEISLPRGPYECPNDSAKVYIYKKMKLYDRDSIRDLNETILKYKMDQLETAREAARELASDRDRANSMIECLTRYLTTLPDSLQAGLSFDWWVGRRKPFDASQFVHYLTDMLRSDPSRVHDIKDSSTVHLFDMGYHMGDIAVYCDVTVRDGTYTFNMYESGGGGLQPLFTMNCNLPEISRYQVLLDKWTDIHGSELLAEEKDFLSGQPGLIFRYGAQFYLVSLDFQVAISGDSIKPGIVHFQWYYPNYKVKWTPTYRILASRNIKSADTCFVTSDGVKLHIDTDAYRLPRVRPVRPVLSA